MVGAHGDGGNELLFEVIGGSALASTADLRLIFSRTWSGGVSGRPTEFGVAFEFSSVAPMGDVNDDGYCDLAVSRPDRYVALVPGRERLVDITEANLESGLAGVVLSIDSPWTQKFFMRDDHAGDLTGDGVPDLVLYDETNDEFGEHAGLVSVWSGAALAEQLR